MWLCLCVCLRLSIFVCFYEYKQQPLIEANMFIAENSKKEGIKSGICVLNRAVHFDEIVEVNWAATLNKDAKNMYIQYMYVFISLYSARGAARPMMTMVTPTTPTISQRFKMTTKRSTKCSTGVLLTLSWLIGFRSNRGSAWKIQWCLHDLSQMPLVHTSHAE